MNENGNELDYLQSGAILCFQKADKVNFAAALRAVKYCVKG